jgi:alpha/beta superfamily hydrolase
LTPITVDLRGPAGRIEALAVAPEAPRFVAMVCHPHPLFGGTMHNHATYRLAKAVNGAGGLALRFNFRGVGRTEGAHDEGRGETDDARAALAWLAERYPDLPRYACGFSFGARVALLAGCPDPGVAGVLAAGLAVKLFDHAAAKTCPKRVAVVQAERDEYGTPDEVRAVLAEALGARQVYVVERASHLFTEDLDRLQAQASAALTWLLT